MWRWTRRDEQRVDRRHLFDRQDALAGAFGSHRASPWQPWATKPFVSTFGTGRTWAKHVVLRVRDVLIRHSQSV
jgi:hypothetical protein